MSKFVPTEAQKRAIEADGSNIIVSAGAGSGKTKVLSERVVYFISEKGYSISDFLIVTFTNAAAAEMKKRIRKALEETNPLEASKVDSSFICTFDSFFLSLVKEYHCLLGLSPNLSIMDGFLANATRRKRLEGIFSSLAENGDPRLKTLVHDYPEITPETLFNYSILLYETLLKNGDYAFASKALRANLADHGYVDGYLGQAIALLKEKADAVQEAAADLQPAKPTKSITNMMAYFAARIDSYDWLVSLPSHLANKPSSKENLDLKLAAQRYGEEKEAFKAFVSLLPSNEHALREEIEADRRTTLLLLDVLDELDRGLRQWRQEKGLFDFNDIAQMALKLTKDEKIREAIASRFKMVMVDEFQDTSSIQNSFIDAIGDGHLYLVGDVKQSIYLFRGARPDLFQTRYLAYKDGKGGQAIDMNANFRSRKEVLLAVNSLFGCLMDERVGGVDYRSGHVIEARQPSFEKAPLQGSPATEILSFDATGRSSIEVAGDEARIIAQDIKEKVASGFLISEDGRPRPVRFSDFAIIADRATSFQKVLRIFNEEQVPLFLRYDENIAENDLIRVIESLVALYKGVKSGDFSSTSFRHAYASIARSFLFEMSDRGLYGDIQGQSLAGTSIAKKMISVVENTKLLPETEVLQAIFDEFDVNDRLLAIGDVNKNENYLDAITNIFRSALEAGFTLDEALGMLKDVHSLGGEVKIESSDPGIDSVVILTIHKSKGLEFPITYFMGLGRMFNSEEFKKSRPMADLATGFHFGKRDDRKNVFALLAGDEKLISYRSESVRLLYVALTRTREKAYLLNPCKGLSTSPYRFQCLLESFAKSVSVEDINLLEEIMSYMPSKVDPLFFPKMRDLVTEEKGKAKDADIKNASMGTLPPLVEDEMFARAFGNYLENHVDNRLCLLLHFFFRGADEQEWTDEIEKPLTLARKESDSAKRSAALELAYRTLGLPVRGFGESLPLSLDDKDILWDEAISSLKGGHLPLDAFRAIDFIFDCDAAPSIKAMALCFLGLPAVEREVSASGFSYRGELAAYVGTTTEGREKAKSFQQMLQPLYRRGYLKKTLVSLPKRIQAATNNASSKALVALDLAANPYPFVREMKASYSAEINLDADPAALRYGTILHETLEGMDFLHPSFDGLPSSAEKIVRAFLASDSARDLEKATVYKEYAFIDERGQEGSIDLLLLFPDKIRVVDYKSRNIDHPEYIDQVKGYMEFARRLFKKEKAEGYLYSLAEGREIKIA